MKYLILLPILLLNSCSYLDLDWSDEETDETDETERSVIADQPKKGFFGGSNNGISIYEQHQRYTFLMKIDRTVTFENAHREKNQIAGHKDENKLGHACKMQRRVGGYTRDILIVDKTPRMFRLMRSVSSNTKKAAPTLIAVDVKSGDTTFEIHCPSVLQYNTVILEDNFGFKIISEKNKLKDNFI